jgi:hypothetical protein
MVKARTQESYATLGHIANGIKATHHGESCTSIFKAAIFTIAKLWKRV